MKPREGKENSDINSMSQTQLIEYWESILEKFSQDPNGEDPANLELLEKITAPEFLDRLILGKGTDGYDNEAKAKKYSLNGRGFVSQILRNDSSKFPNVNFEDNKLVSEAKIAIYDYLVDALNSPRLDDKEKKKIREIHEASVNKLRNAWQITFSKFKVIDKYAQTKSEEDKPDNPDELLVEAKHSMDKLRFIFNTQDSLPDFITPKDIATLCIFHPDVINNLELTDALLKKIGDIDQFKKHLDERLKQAVKNGVISEDHQQQFPNFYSKIESEQAKEMQRKFNEMKATFPEKTDHNIDNAHRFLNNLENDMIYKSQMQDFYAILAKGKLSKIELKDQEGFVDYMGECSSKFLDEEDQTKFTEDFAIEMNPLLLEYDSLEKMHKTIQESQKKEGAWNGKEFEATANEIQERLKEIEKLLSRSKRVFDQTKAYKDSRPDVKKEEEIYKNTESLIRRIRSSAKRKKPLKKQSKKGRILYLSIMTRKSIHEQKPTREYLNQLYSDSVLNAFINDAWRGHAEFRNKIALLEKELVEAKASALAKNNAEALGSKKITHDDYIAQQSALIQQEIVLSDNSMVQAKTLEHWINVLEAARNRKDALTVEIISNALLDISIQPLIHKGYVSTLISEEVKKKFNKMTGEMQQEQEAKRQKQEEKIQEEKREEEKLAEPPVVEEKAPEQKINAPVQQVHKAMEELYAIDQRFSADMKKLQDFFLLDKNDSTTLYCDDLENSTSPPFVELKETKDLNDCIRNMEEIISVLKASDFSASLKSNELATLNMQWMTSYITDNKLDESKTTKDTYPGGLNSETVKPVQKNPRYVLTLKKMIENAEKLRNVYQESLSEEVREDDEQLKRLNKVITELQAQVKAIEGQILVFNSNIDMLQLNRRVAYKLFKETSKLPLQTRIKIGELLNQLRVTEPVPTTQETAATLKQIQSQYGIDTRNYVAEIYIHRAEQDLAAVYGKSDEPSLIKKLNREIAKELFKSTEQKLDAKTQEKIMNFAESLFKEPPTAAEKILEFLNTVELTRADKLKQHRLYHRMLRAKIADYLKNKEERLFNEISNTPLEAKDEKEEKDEKQSAALRTERARQVTEYLVTLKMQWETERDARKFTSEEKEDKEIYDKKIKLISDSITAINKFDGAPSILNIVYPQLIAQLKKLGENEPASKIQVLIEPVIHELNEKVATLDAKVIPEINEEKNTFSQACFDGIGEVYKAIDGEFKSYLANPESASNEAIAKTLISYLNMIQTTWKVQEFELLTPAQQDIIQRRENAIKIAMGKLEEKPPANSKEVLEQLNHALRSIVRSPITTKTKPKQKKELQEAEKLALKTGASLANIIYITENFVKPAMAQFEVVKLKNAAETLFLKIGSNVVREEKQIRERAEKIPTYLQALKDQWEAESKSTPEKKEANDKKIKLVSDAMTLINKFDHAPSILNIVYPQLILQLRELGDVKAAGNIQLLIEPVDNKLGEKIDALEKEGIPAISEEENAFSQACFEAIGSGLEDMGRQFTYYIENPGEVSNENISSAVIEYLELIRNKWTVQELDPWVLNHPEIINRRREKIEKAIADLKKDPPSDRNQILTKLESDLEAITAPYAKPKHFYTRSTEKSKEKETLLSPMQTDVELISQLRSRYTELMEAIKTHEEEQEKEEQRVLAEQKAIEEKLVEEKRAKEQAQAELEVLEAKVAVNKPFIEGIPSPKKEEDKHAEAGDAKEKKDKPELYGTAAILHSFKKHIKPQFAKEHLSYAPLPADQYSRKFKYDAGDKDWTRISSREIDKKSEIKSGELRSDPVKREVELPEGKSNTYQHEKSHAQITISRQNNTVLVTAKKEPDNYDKLVREEKRIKKALEDKPEEKRRNELQEELKKIENQKLPIDLEMSEKMIRLFVDTCGNSAEEPIHIDYSSNETRMKAQILICMAHDLEYRVPPAVEQYNYSFLKNPKELEAEAAQLKAEIKEGQKIAMLNFSVGKIGKLRKRVDALEHYLKKYPDDKKLNADYKEDIALLRQLIDKAAEGKIDVKAFQAVSQRLEKAEKAIEADEKAIEDKRAIVDKKETPPSPPPSPSP